MPIGNFQRIVSHHKWWKHLDELLVFVLIEMYDLLEDFDTIRDVLEVDDDEVRQGDLAIGIGQGNLDDKCPDGTRKENCSAMLFAKKFDLISQFPEIELILKSVNNVDQHGSTDNLALAKIIHDVSEEFGKEAAIDLARKAFSSRITQNYKNFHDPKTISFYQSAYKFKVKVSDGEDKEVVIFFADEHSPNATPYAFWKGAVCAIIINQETGNIQILGNGKQKVDLKLVYSAICRVSEEEAKKWYFHPPCFLLNGAESHPNILPTLLTLDEIINIMKKYLI